MKQVLAGGEMVDVKWCAKVIAATVTASSAVACVWADRKHNV